MIVELTRQDLLQIARIVELWKPTAPNIYERWKQDIVELLRKRANGE